MTLYFGGELPAKEKLSFSLPPKPPAGAFDVMYRDDLIYKGSTGNIVAVS